MAIGLVGFDLHDLLGILSDDTSLLRSNTVRSGIEAERRNLAKIVGDIGTGPNGQSLGSPNDVERGGQAKG